MNCNPAEFLKQYYFENFLKDRYNWAFINLQSFREVKPREPMLDDDAERYIIGRGDLTNLVPTSKICKITYKKNFINQAAVNIILNLNVSRFQLEISNRINLLYYEIFLNYRKSEP